LGEKAAGGQLAHQALIDRGLEFEIEIVERLHRGEVRDLERHGDTGALLRLDLLPEHGIEEIEVGGLGARGVIEHRIETLGDVAEPQARELLGDPGVDDGAHCSPPATMAAYSLRSRPSRASDGGAKSSPTGVRHKPTKCAGSMTRANGSQQRACVATSAAP
jgi:hypothetical protein